MKIYSKNGIDLHKHTNQHGTRFRLYVHGKYYPFPKLPLNSKTEFTHVRPKDESIVRVKYVCPRCKHTSMEAECLKACDVICTECRSIMLPPVKVKRLRTMKKLAARRKGMERF